MPSLETLSEADLHGQLNDQSLRKARGYLGRIKNPVRSGQALSAEVQDTFPCQVEIEVSPGDIHAWCSCSYAWGGYCQHVGAVLLKWMQAPRSFAVVEAACQVQGDYPIAAIVVEPPPTHRPATPPAWLAISFEERCRRDRQQLEKWLDLVTIQDLRGIARQRGWAVRGTRKAEVVGQVLAQIDDPDDLRRAIAALDGEHLQALRALVVLGDQKIYPEDVERVAGVWGRLGRHKQIGTYTRHLCERGLALAGALKGDYPDSQVDFVPPALARRLPPLLASVVSTADDLPAGSVASGLRLADPYAPIRAASQLIQLLEQSPVPLRPPMPRPRLERFHRELQGWDYDPVELAQAEREGLWRSRTSQTLAPAATRELALSVPPAAHLLPDEAVARLAPLVARGEPGRSGGEAQLDFLHTLLVAAGLLQPGSPTTVWPEVKAEFLRCDEPRQRALLARLYFDLSSWSEMWEVLRADDSLRLKRVWRYTYLKPEHLAADLVRFRHLVLRTLASLPDDRWIRVADLLPLLCAIWPRFDGMVWETYSHLNVMGAWFLVRNGRPVQPDNADDWRAAQGAFVRQVIAGPLHWLGLADLLLDGEELVAFRLHSLADLYWGRVEAPVAPRHAAFQARNSAPAQAVTVDQFNVTVDPTAISIQAHSLLDKIARLEVTETNRFVYRLDAQVAYRTFEGGAALDDLLDDWQHLLAIPLPGAIREQLVAWWQSYGRVRLYKDLTVIEFSDDYALAEMKAVTSLEQHLVAEISPRLVIVRPEAAEGLAAELEKAGYTPKLTDRV